MLQLQRRDVYKHRIRNFKSSANHRIGRHPTSLVATGDATPIGPSSGLRPNELRAQSGSTGLATRLTTSCMMLVRQCFTHLIAKNTNDKM